MMVWSRFGVKNSNYNFIPLKGIKICLVQNSFFLHRNHVGHHSGSQSTRRLSSSSLVAAARRDFVDHGGQKSPKSPVVMQSLALQYATLTFQTIAKCWNLFWMIVMIWFCVVGDSERENTWALRVRDCSLSSLIPLEGIKIFGGNRKIANINFIPSKGIKLGLRINSFTGRCAFGALSVEIFS